MTQMKVHLVLKALASHAGCIIGLEAHITGKCSSRDKDS
jgi:hypothetical protein